MILVSHSAPKADGTIDWFIVEPRDRPTEQVESLIRRGRHVTAFGDADQAEEWIKRQAAMVQWTPDDTAVLEIQKAADTLGMSFQDTTSFLIGVGLGEAIERGLIGERAVPLKPGELLQMMTALIASDTASPPE